LVDLQLEPGGAKPGLEQHGVNQRRQIGALELDRREVDGDLQADAAIGDLAAASRRVHRPSGR
jgi:hypothetical protein